MWGKRRANEICWVFYKISQQLENKTKSYWFDWMGSRKSKAKKKIGGAIAIINEKYFFREELKQA